jgi:hypothetical protein
VTSLDDKIRAEVVKHPGITDRSLAEAIFGVGTPQQRVNGACRNLAANGMLTRAFRSDGLVGNYATAESAAKNVTKPEPTVAVDSSFFSEDEVKRVLEG